MRLLALLSGLTLCPLLAAAPGGTFTLHIFQGFHFGTGQVVKSGTDTADLNFTYQTRRIGFISYLGAEKIKFFESAPPASAISDAAGWKDYVAGPSPGYYLLRAHRDKKFYLVQLISFENQGKAASYWVLDCRWHPFSGAAASLSAAPAAPGNARPVGRDEMAALRGRVVAKVKVQTALETGTFGEVKNVEFLKPGSADRVRLDLLNAKGEASLAVDPGRYDVWVSGRRANRKLVGSIDLTGYKPGDSVPYTVNFDGFGAAPSASQRSSAAAQSSAGERIRRAQEAAAKRQY